MSRRSDGLEAVRRAAFQGFVLFFDRFCTELEDRRQFPYKTFGIIGAKCAGPTAAVTTCLSNGVLLFEAVQARLEVEPAPAAAHTALYHNMLGRLAPTGRLNRLHDYENPQCKFLKCAVYAIEGLTQQDKSGMPTRLSRLMTNTTGGPKLEIVAFLETGRALLRELGCKSRRERNLSAEARRVLASVMASVAPKYAPVPSGPIMIGVRRHRTASSPEGTRKQRTRVPARPHRTESSSEGTRRRLRKR